MRAPATGQRGQQRAYEGGAEQERADHPGLGEGHHLGAVRESRPLRALALSQVGAPEVVRTGPQQRRVLELAPRNAPVVVAIGGEAGAQPARSLRRAVTALLELVPGVGAGRDRVALDDRVSRDDGDGRERDGDHRRGADAARARRGDLNAFVGHRGQGAENGESRACEQQRPQRAVEDGSGRARGLQVVVDVEQRVQDRAGSPRRRRRTPRWSGRVRERRGWPARQRPEGPSASRGSGRGARRRRAGPRRPGTARAAGPARPAAPRARHREAGPASRARRSRSYSRPGGRSGPRRSTGPTGPLPRSSAARSGRSRRPRARSRRAGPRPSGRAAARARRARGSRRTAGSGCPRPTRAPAAPPRAWRAGRTPRSRRAGGSPPARAAPGAAAAAARDRRRGRPRAAASPASTSFP